MSTTTHIEITYIFNYTQDDCDYQGIPNTVESVLTNAREAIDAGVPATFISVASKTTEGY